MLSLAAVTAAHTIFLLTLTANSHAGGDTLGRSMAGALAVAGHDGGVNPVFLDMKPAGRAKQRSRTGLSQKITALAAPADTGADRLERSSREVLQEDASSVVAELALVSAEAGSSAGMQMVPPTDSDGTLLLTAIARCLPSAWSSPISSALLRLELNSQGVLIAAPEIEFGLGPTTPGEAAAADALVQAALQCGPYPTPAEGSGAVAVSLDAFNGGAARLQLSGSADKPDHRTAPARPALPVRPPYQTAPARTGA